MQPTPHIAADVADLEQCATEPIHIPGAIQAHGALLVLAGDPGVITQASENCAGLLGRAPSQLLGRGFAEIFGTAPAHQVRDARERWRQLPSRPATIPRLQATAEQALCGHLHESDGLVILEIEPDLAAEDDCFSADWYRHALLQFETVRAAPDLDGKLARAVTVVRALTGYDRVMIYRFDRDWNGQVVAEARASSLGTYLGLHYYAVSAYVAKTVI
ncbi:MAG: hypothetical protein K9M02_05270 [Thiohalocapsa sp.]|nr:hypothetical protein [Thiohalocapsa sp.]